MTLHNQTGSTLDSAKLFITSVTERYRTKDAAGKETVASRTWGADMAAPIEFGSTPRKPATRRIHAQRLRLPHDAGYSSPHRERHRRRPAFRIDQVSSIAPAAPMQARAPTGTAAP